MRQEQNEINIFKNNIYRLNLGATLLRIICHSDLWRQNQRCHCVSCHIESIRQHKSITNTYIRRYRVCVWILLYFLF